jgi:hypothetical protein
MFLLFFMTLTFSRLIDSIVLVKPILLLWLWFVNTSLTYYAITISVESYRETKVSHAPIVQLTTNVVFTRPRVRILLR